MATAVVLKVVGQPGNRSPRWLNVRIVDGSPIVVAERTTEPTPTDPEGVHRYFTSFLEAVEVFPPGAFDLCIDARNAPGRNDACFEEARAHYGPLIYQRFHLVAIVVNSVVGKLQLKRYRREEPAQQFSTHPSVEDAIRYLDHHRNSGKSPGSLPR
ncbi:MAG: hypothetical protein AAGF12_38520 [Myxococcota bacterium]